MPPHRGPQWKQEYTRFVLFFGAGCISLYLHFIISGHTVTMYVFYQKKIYRSNLFFKGRLKAIPTLMQRNRKSPEVSTVPVPSW